MRDGSQRISLFNDVDLGLCSRRARPFGRINLSHGTDRSWNRYAGDLFFFAVVKVYMRHGDQSPRFCIHGMGRFFFTRNFLHYFDFRVGGERVEKTVLSNVLRLSASGSKIEQERGCAGSSENNMKKIFVADEKESEAARRHYGSAESESCHDDDAINRNHERAQKKRSDRRQVFRNILKRALSAFFQYTDRSEENDRGFGC